MLGDDMEIILEPTGDPSSDIPSSRRSTAA
jgi:hypothetical protein